MLFYKVILKFPKTAIAIVLSITAFFGWHARHVELNNSIEAVLPDGHRAVTQDREIKQVFESREMILIGVLHEGGIFNTSTLQKVQGLTLGTWQLTVATEDDERRLGSWRERLGGAYGGEIDALLQGGLDVTDRGIINNMWIDIRDNEGVDQDFRAFVERLRLKLSPISDVISLAQVDNITATEFGLSVKPPMETVPRSDEGLAALAVTVFDNEMFVNGLVSEDSTGTGARRNQVQLLNATERPITTGSSPPCRCSSLRRNGRSA